MLGDNLYAALLLRYPRDEHVILQEVTSVDGARRADAIAIQFWASRGMEMHGFEAKASRSDWLRELKQPAKAESMFALCDRFWLLTESEDVVRDGELPPTWGWLELRGKQLRQKVAAPKLAPAPRPWAFIVRLLRKCHEEAKIVEARQTNELHNKAFEEAQAAVASQHESRIATALARVDSAREDIRRAEEILGMPLGRWDSIKNLRAIAALVRQDQGPMEAIRKLRALHEDLGRALAAVDESAMPKAVGT